MMVGDNMTNISREEEEELVVPEFDAVEIVVVMKIVPTSSCGGRGNNRRILLEQFRVVLRQW
jgi:hypothetical protein